MGEFSCVAIETSTRRGSVAVCNGGLTVRRKLEESATSSRQIFGIINELFEELAITVAELDCVAFSCGPGSFTGVRVAASAAQGIAYSRQLPVCSVSSLEALAFDAADTGDRVLACLDARMGEAYIGGYRFSEGKVPVVELADTLANPADWQLPANSTGVIAAGPGWLVFPELLDGQHTGPLRTEIWPDAGAVLEVSRQRFETGQTITAAAAMPNYLRNKVTQ
jgi:tRNA threonylcarbamoyladenosine biosynthesis protein TsaB